MTSRSAATGLSLVEDGVLQLSIERPLWPLAERWVPRGLERPSRATSPDAMIHVGASRVPLSRPIWQPTLSLDRITAWVDDARGIVVLRGGAPANGGMVSYGTGRARLSVDPDLMPEAAADVYAMLTVSAALLLASLGRALVHAAAVVTHDGEAWLLVGDARSGKSTTCATLAVAGWGFLSDDQVILSLDPERGVGVAVEGWLRPFHLDSAPAPAPGGERREVHPAELGLDRWRRRAPLAGVILPVVSPSEPTRLAPVAAADALAGLVRQSPWLLACRRSAPAVLDLLTRASSGGGAFSLRLGRDTFRDPERLEACLGGLVGSREQGAGSRRDDAHKDAPRGDGTVRGQGVGCEHSAHAQIPVPGRVAASTQPGGPHP